MGEAEREKGYHGDKGHKTTRQGTKKGMPTDTTKGLHAQVMLVYASSQ